MRKILFILMAIAFFGLSIFGFPGCSGGDSGGAAGVSYTTPSSSATASPAPYIDGELLVRLKPGALASSVASEVGGEVIGQFSISDMNYVKISLPDGYSVENAINVIESGGNVDFAEPDYICQKTIVPNDPCFSNHQYCHERMSASAAWDISQGSSSTTIAIIDTGIDGTHPEFSGRMRTGYDFVDTSLLTGTENSDTDGHGTHVTGIAAASGNNGVGVAGMNWNCRIMPVKVVGDNGASTGNVALGVVFAKTYGARVINLSLGGSGYSQTLKDAIDSALESGVLVVAAMGNDYGEKLKYPAGYQGVIAVGSTEAHDEVSDFSTRGFNISVSAPGSEIYSTYPDSTYGTLSGTSMATPQVTGLCSLIIGQNPSWSIGQIKTQLESSADDLGAAGFDYGYGWGRINAEKALGTALGNNYGNMQVSVTASGSPQSGIDVVIRDLDGNTISTAKTNSQGYAKFFLMRSGSYKASANYSGITLSSGTLAVNSGATAASTLNF